MGEEIDSLTHWVAIMQLAEEEAEDSEPEEEMEEEEEEANAGQKGTALSNF